MNIYRIKKSVLLLLLSILVIPVISQPKSDAVIVGHVTCKGNHIPFATIIIKGTTIGTATDQTGHYTLVNVPPGTLTIIARAVGYKTLFSLGRVTQKATGLLRYLMKTYILKLLVHARLSTKMMLTFNRNPAEVTCLQSVSIIIYQIQTLIFL